MSSLRVSILAAAEAVEAACVKLGDLDRAIGDGDHGITMAIGARAVRQRLHAADHVHIGPSASGGRWVRTQASMARRASDRRVTEADERLRSRGRPGDAPQ